MAVRTEVRRGKRRYIIDIRYTNATGARLRFRQDAEVQTLAAARAEDTRRLGMLATTGVPFEAGGAPNATSVGAARATISAPEQSASAATPSATFEEAARSFLKVYGGTRLKPSTKRGYEVVLDGFLFKRIGSKHLDAIGPMVVRELDAVLVARGRKPSTRRQMQCVVRSVLRHAKEAGLIERLPELPPLPKTGATITHALTREEVGRILAITAPPHQLALELAAYAGLRAGEVRGLRWKDVELDRGVLVVRRSRCRGIEAAPKSGHERVVPLHPKLIDALKTIDVRPSNAYVTGPKPGEPWGEHALRHAFKSACKKLELAGFRFHDLRHAFVTELFRGGTPAPVVQRLAGHEHLTTTQRYAHAQLPDLTAAVARLAW